MPLFREGPREEELVTESFARAGEGALSLAREEEEGSQEMESSDAKLCEVTVSCSPKKGARDGSLEVKFEYTGDPLVVSFLLDQARRALEEGYES